MGIKLSIPTLILCLLTFVFLALTDAKVPSGKIRGMAFTSGHFPRQYFQKYATRSLINLRSTGVKYVHITVIIGQEQLSSSSSYEVTDEKSIRMIIRKLHRMKFKVFLKPIVQTRNFEWRGFIKGTDAWFKNVYNPYISHMARIAQEEKVEIFSVGSELRASEDKLKQWTKTIGLVKRVYKGSLTYVANHDSYRRIQFWKLLDFISISGYFKLLDKYDRANPPSVKRTMALWKKQADMVNAWRLKNKLGGRKVLLAEAGAMSKGNGVVYTEPWDYMFQGPTDLEIQALMYEALLSAFMKPKWSLGVILYDWLAQPDAGKSHPSIQQYTPQNKPAQKVMAKYFK